jgi:hypothetical protein
MAGFITAMCALIVALQGIGILPDTKESGKQSGKSELAPLPPALHTEKPQSYSTTDLEGDLPGLYQGAMHGFMVFENGTREPIETPVSVSIGKVTSGRFDLSMTIASMGNKTWKGVISGDNVTFGDYSLSLTGRFNRRSISVTTSMVIPIPPSDNIRARGVQSLVMVGIDLFKN